MLPLFSTTPAQCWQEIRNTWNGFSLIRQCTQNLPITNLSHSARHSTAYTLTNIEYIVV